MSTFLHNSNFRRRSVPLWAALLLISTIGVGVGLKGARSSEGDDGADRLTLLDSHVPPARPTTVPAGRTAGEMPPFDTRPSVQEQAPSTAPDPDRPRLTLRVDVAKDIFEFGYQAPRGAEALIELSVVPGPSIPRYEHMVSQTAVAAIHRVSLNGYKKDLTTSDPSRPAQIGIRAALFARNVADRGAYTLIETKIADIQPPNNENNAPVGTTRPIP